MPLKVKILVWLTFLDRIHTKNNLIKKGVINYGNTCVFCNNENETGNHIFLNCQFVLSIWASLKHNLKVSNLPDNIKDLMTVWRETNVDRKIRMEWDISVAALIWNVWNERNKRIFQ